MGALGDVLGAQKIMVGFGPYNKKKDAGLWLAKQFWDPPRDV